MSYSGKMQIVLCDENINEANGYLKICRGICGELDVPVEFKHYSTANDFLFDADDDEFLSSVSVLIVEPNGSFETIPALLRKNGYDGAILYLSHSNSLEHFHQAFDVGACNFVQKGTSPEILSRFQSVFESVLQTAKQIDRQFMMVSYAGEYRRISVEDILYFETAADHMINVVYNGGNFKFLSTMQSLEERFGDRGFVRVHRSYLVSVNAIHRVSSDELILNSGRSILVSRDRYPYLKSAMACWQA